MTLAVCKTYMLNAPLLYTVNLMFAFLGRICRHDGLLAGYD